MASFTYSKLPRELHMTRMLRLLPHKDSNAPIRSELIDYELSVADGRSHLYEALSYVWYDDGDSSDREPQSIILNDCNFPVTKNLYAALLRLRNHQLERMLWIDAICINQNDNDDKKKQIPLMRTIYAQASCVIVWLGEARDNSDKAFESIRCLAGESVDYGLPAKKSDSWASTDEPSNVQNISIDSEGHDACLMLLQRNWFRRIWVLQEVGVARCISVTCGRIEMNGYTFCKGFSKLNLSSGLLSLTHPVLDIMKDATIRPKYQLASRGTLSIGELIDMYRNHDATVRHDKVYALLGLCADDPKASALEPNYGLPWSDVLKKVTTYILGGKCSVQTWPDRDIAVIKGKGWILGYIAQVRPRTSEDDRAYVSIEFNHTAGWVYKPLERNNKWRLRAPEELIQEGDILCLLQGTAKPSIIRLCKDHFEMVMTTVTPQTSKEESYDLEPQKWHPIGGFLYDVLLTWRIPWTSVKNDTGLQDPVELRNIVPEYQECPCEAKTRFNNMVLTVNNITRNIIKCWGLYGTEVLEHILVRCVANFPFSEDVVEAAVSRYSGERILELLIQYHGQSLPITANVVKAAASTFAGVTMVELLLRYRGESLPITEDVVKAAAMNYESYYEDWGFQTMGVLLKHRANDLPISEDVVSAAAANTKRYGYKCMALLIKHRGESLPITEDVVKAAAANPSSNGYKVMETLIQHRGESLPITEDVVKAAASNLGERGYRITRLLTQYLGDSLPITQDVVKAAAANPAEKGYKITRLLTQHRGDSSTNRSRYE